MVKDRMLSNRQILATATVQPVAHFLHTTDDAGDGRNICYITVARVHYKPTSWVGNSPPYSLPRMETMGLTGARDGMFPLLCSTPSQSALSWAHFVCDRRTNHHCRANYPISAPSNDYPSAPSAAFFCLEAANCRSLIDQI
jgi:hypothetical protein